MTILIIRILFTAAVIAVILGGYWLAFRNAPEGYEDESGFHYGRK